MSARRFHSRNTTVPQTFLRQSRQPHSADRPPPTKSSRPGKHKGTSNLASAKKAEVKKLLQKTYIHPQRFLATSILQIKPVGGIKNITDSR